MRVTKELLRNHVQRINRFLKENGKDIEYGLDIAYGGYRLVKYVGSGESERSYRLTAKELYYVLYTIEKVLTDVYY